MSQSAYARAGVDIEAGDRAVELMKAHVKAATRAEVMGGLGGFAGLFDASALKGFRHPVLATSTDGVGTKVDIARAMGVYHTVGWDLVGMLVDDLVVCGAEPLFLTDYIACGRVVPERIADIVRGIAEACAAANTALIGGETAEHPGLMGPDDFDMAGATVGVVEADEILGPERSVRATLWWPWRPQACTATAIRWCGVSCSPTPACASTRTSTNWDAPSARNCWNRRGSTPAMRWP